MRGSDMTRRQLHTKHSTRIRQSHGEARVRARVRVRVRVRVRIRDGLVLGLALGLGPNHIVLDASSGLQYGIGNIFELGLALGCCLPSQRRVTSTPNFQVRVRVKMTGLADLG